MADDWGDEWEAKLVEGAPIKKDKVQNAYKALKRYGSTHPGQPGSDALAASKDIGEALAAIGFDSYLLGGEGPWPGNGCRVGLGNVPYGSILIIGYDGEWRWGGVQEQCLKALAPYLDEGAYLQFQATGEPHHTWRYVARGRRLQRVHPILAWPDNGENV